MEVWVEEARLWGHLSVLFSQAPTPLKVLSWVLSTLPVRMRLTVWVCLLYRQVWFSLGSDNHCCRSCLMLMIRSVSCYHTAAADASRQGILKENWGLGRWLRGYSACCGSVRA